MKEGETEVRGRMPESHRGDEEREGNKLGRTKHRDQQAGKDSRRGVGGRGIGRRKGQQKEQRERVIRGLHCHLHACQLFSQPLGTFITMVTDSTFHLDDKANAHPGHSVLKTDMHSSSAF